MKLPNLSDKLNLSQLKFLETFTKSCRKSILEMTTNADSGHPGGSLSSIDFLSVLYTFIISQKGRDVVISNGHISPAIYSILGEFSIEKKDEIIKTFRKAGSKFEGHVTRHVKGITYGTGPLGIGVSVASGFALQEKLYKKNKTIYGILGDGESQEGQVYEMINFASKYKLDNLVLIMDYNQVQLTDSLKKIMPINPSKIFKSSNWNVIEIDGHNFKNIWEGLKKAEKRNGKPTIIIAKTIMGKGSLLMEPEGGKYKSTWHGKAAKYEEIKKDLKNLSLTKSEENILKEFRKKIKWRPKLDFTKKLSKLSVKLGKPILYNSETLTDCRSAYGNALFDLCKLNKNILAFSADLSGSTKTNTIENKFQKRHIEVGIAEQHMMSCAGGISLKGYIPFASTFGAFATSRAKDQVRVNDINETNLKIVSTHCGLSVGEDGPTHQAIDDMGSMLGLFNTHVIEPSDPNHTDRIIRYITSVYGNFYVRMGRHKIPVLTNEKGKPFFNEKYKYVYGKCDILRKGSKLTIITSGPMVNLALKARELHKIPKNIEIIIASSPKKFDENLLKSIKKTKNILVLEDHNIYSGLGSQIANFILENNIKINNFKKMGVKKYELSGKPEELYNKAGIGIKSISNEIIKLI